tara:strand:+ start:2294 stop:2473 length:180 start_codon:yes stop_codon:yes gene_type:complete
MTDYKKRLDEQYKEIFRHKSKQGLTLLTQQEAIFIRAVMRIQENDIKNGNGQKDIKKKT